MAIDRRVARTRAALYDALVALVRRKDYDFITVQDILDEADVGRATFYAHFASKDDLLRRSLDRLRDLLLAARDRRRRPPFPFDPAWSLSRVLFEHVAEFADVRSRLAGGRGGAIVREAIDEVLASVLRESMPAEGGARIPRELAIRHLVATVNTTLRWWTEHHPGLSPAEAEELFKELLIDGLPEADCAIFTLPPAPPAR